jgi:hypothetical protein
MAQSGFPDSNTISPQVIVREVDNSLLPTTTNPHNIGLVGFASKGPINKPTVVTSRADLYTKFGHPYPQSGDPHMIYAAEIVLENADSVTLVRVADINSVSGESAQVANVTVASAGGQVQIQSNTAGSYVFASDSFFRWRLNGVLASKTLVALAGTYTVAQLVTTLNDQLVAADGIQFYANTSNKISVETTFSFGVSSSLELVSVKSAMYGPSSVTGLGTLMTTASLTGSATKYPNNVYTSAGNYDFTGLTGLNLLVVVDGTNSTAIDGIVQVIDFTSLEGQSNTLGSIVTFINNEITGGTIPGGFTASAVSNSLKFTTNHAGRDAAILVKAASTADTIFGLSNTTAYGTSPTGSSSDNNTYTDGIVTGSANSSGDVTFTIQADSPGIEGNLTSVVITNSNSGDGTFSMTVYTNGNQVEAFGNLTKDSTSTFYVGTYLQEVSNYITVVDNVNVAALPLPGTYALSGGTDGIPADPSNQDILLIGDPAAGTGLQLFSDPDQVNVDLLAIPGHTSTSIATALITVAEGRDDCMAFVDPPFALTSTEIVQWQNGAHPLNTDRFDSKSAALFYPWCKYADLTNAVDVWIPPSGPALSTFAFSDNVGNGPWDAAAGETRGLVNSIEDVYSFPSLSERNAMYGNQNCVNPIINRNGIGFAIWGNKTLQRRPTALDRINATRMLFFAKKQIQVQAGVLLFQQHDSKLEARFTLIATGILENIKLQSGISAYFVQCDSTLNTPDVIDRHELRANIGIQPTPTAEFIFTTIIVDSTGSF